MTEAIGIDLNNRVCDNCRREGEVASGQPRKFVTLDAMPAGWGALRVILNEGVATDSVICDECVKAVRATLKERRGQDEEAVLEAQVLDTIEDVEEPSKEAIQATVKEMAEQEASEESIEGRAPELSAEPTAQEAGTLPTKPQQLSNRAKQRAQAAIRKTEATEAEADKNAAESRVNATDAD